MQAIAKLNNVPTSPRKMRLIADLIRGMDVDLALNTLKFDAKIGSKRMEKLVLSALSNWQEKNKDQKIKCVNYSDMTIYELDASDNLVETDLSGEPAEVSAICNAVWTTDVKAAWKAKLIADKSATP